MSPRSIDVSEQMHRYLLDRGVHEHPVMKELRLYTAEHHAQSQMQLSPEQGQLFRVLLKLIGAKTSLDIGTFTGYSALAAALALPDDGVVIACDVSADDTATAATFWEKAHVDHKIDLRLGPALDTLDGLLADGFAATFDFSFIDADKGNYQTYFERSLELVRPGGLIAIDNTLWSGRVLEKEPELASTKTIKSFNDYVYAQADVDMVLLPVGDGLTLVRKK